MRSVPEWAASEMRPRLCVARPVPSLSPISASAANTDQSAAFRWASTPGSVRPPGAGARGLSGRASPAWPATLPATRLGRRDRLRRPDKRVLPEREVAALRLAQLEWRDRGELDLRLCRAEQPAVVVHLGARFGGEETVALGEEELERARLRVERLPVRPVAPGEHPARLADPHALHFLPAAASAAFGGAVYRPGARRPGPPAFRPPPQPPRPGTPRGGEPPPARGRGPARRGGA